MHSAIDFAAPVPALAALCATIPHFAVFMHYLQGFIALVLAYVPLVVPFGLPSADNVAHETVFGVFTAHKLPPDAPVVFSAVFACFTFLLARIVRGADVHPRVRAGLSRATEFRTPVFAPLRSRSPSSSTPFWKIVK